MNYKFNLERFQQLNGKLCPCLVVNKENAVQENMCPCETFIKSGECRCRLFQKIE